MASDIGTAVIEIIGNTKPFEQSISGLERSGGRQFASLGEKFGTQLGERIGSSVARTAKRGLLAVGASIAAVVGVAAVTGLKRFTTIEDATKSLTLILGDADKAAGLLQKTLEVVEGTPFALDQFVQTAQRLAVAGVDLNRIPGVLEAIADAGAAFGGSAEVVDSLTDSFARIATSSTLSLREVRALEVKGVPALKILANQAGVSADEMAKSISSGAISASEALDGLVKGLQEGTDGLNGLTPAFKDQRKQVGNLSAEWANLRTAVARAGANFIAAFGDASKGGNAFAKILSNLNKTVGVIGEAFEKVAERIAGSEGFGKVEAFFEELPGKVERSLKEFNRIWERDGFVEAITRSLERAEFGRRGGELLERLLGFLTKAVRQVPADKVTAFITELFVRGIQGLASATATITAAVVEAAPAIIKGIIEGLFRAAIDNPLDTAKLFILMGLPGIGPVFTGLLVGIFSKLPFGFIIAPFLAKLGLALQSGMTALIGSIVVPKAALAGAFTGVQASAATAAGATGVGGLIAKVGVLTAAVAVPLAIILSTAAAATALDRLLTKMGVLREEAEEVAAALEIDAKATMTLETTEFDERVTATGSAIAGLNTAVATPQINADPKDFNAKRDAVTGDLNKLNTSVNVPTIGLDNTRALSGTGAVQNSLNDIGKGATAVVQVEARNTGILDSIIGRLRSIAGRVWSAVVNVNRGHTGGLVVPTGHSGGMMVPKLHAGTFRPAPQMFNLLRDRLRSDERLAVLQLGELVVSKGDVQKLQREQGSGGGEQNITVNVDSQDPDVRLAAAVASALQLQPVQITLDSRGGDALMREILKSLRAEVARGGGNVQRVFGS